MFFEKNMLWRDKDLPTYRHELKYFCSDGELLIIEQRIKNICVRDVHTSDSGIYSIRSLYFDDAFNSCYWENQNGVSPREKFRIRIYNADVSCIKLECKRKEQSGTHKDSCELSVQQVQDILDGKFFLPEDAPSLLRKFYAQYTQRMLRPKVIVAYERTPFVYAAGNVRITFDRNLAYSVNVKDFMEKELQLCPVMPMGKQILEVKYDAFLPDFLYETMSIGSLQLDTCSKYCLCREKTL